jgi:hypothetical protein
VLGVLRYPAAFGERGPGARSQLGVESAGPIVGSELTMNNISYPGRA